MVIRQFGTSINRLSNNNRSKYANKKLEKYWINEDIVSNSIILCLYKSNRLAE